MNVLLFGATGMVGEGVLHECLGDPRVANVTAVVRSPLARTHPKLHVIRRDDFFDFSGLATAFSDIDACFFCLGVSSAGMREAAYYRLTYDLTLAAANVLAAHRPGAVFCYVSGQGSDSSGKGRVMWARVKGRTENALLELPLDAYMFRPGFIRPRPGVKSKTRLYRMAYALFGPLYPLIRWLAPNLVTTAEDMGRAMIAVAANGYPKRRLEIADLNAAASPGK